jgi:hypothetical protein
MRHKAIPHDPFHDDQPQITNTYKYEQPPDLRGFDSAKGGKHVKRELTDDGFTADFVPPPVPDLNFTSTKKGKR